jgi:hypothetical protein
MNDRNDWYLSAAWKSCLVWCSAGPYRRKVANNFSGSKHLLCILTPPTKNNHVLIFIFWDFMRLLRYHLEYQNLGQIFFVPITYSDPSYHNVDLTKSTLYVKLQIVMKLIISSVYLSELENNVVWNTLGNGLLCNLCGFAERAKLVTEK